MQPRRQLAGAFEIVQGSKRAQIGRLKYVLRVLVVPCEASRNSEQTTTIEPDHRFEGPLMSFAQRGEEGPIGVVDPPALVMRSRVASAVSKA